MKHCGIDLEAWLHGFDDTEAAVRETVDLIRNHPLMAHDVTVGGYVINTCTGELKPICRAEVSA
jgi:carbonic anhydrase